MVRNNLVRRAVVRLRGGRSADDRDVERYLRRALKRAARREGDPQEAQVAGEAVEHEDYVRWRERKLRRGVLTAAPEPERGRYALVLYAIHPSGTAQFVAHGAARHLGPPTVGQFLPAVEPQIALAATLAGWLEPFPRPVLLAPPLLYVDGRWRVAELGLDWPLAPYGREPA